MTIEMHGASRPIPVKQTGLGKTLRVHARRDPGWDEPGEPPGDASGGSDKSLTNSYIAMTQSPGLSCTRLVLLLMSRHTPQTSRGGARHRRAASLWGVVFCAFAAVRAIAAPAAITLEAESAQQFYREGTENEIYVQARIRTAAADEAGPGQLAPAAPPVRNIAFVLDRSGSMAGDRMESLQKALATVLDQIGDDDVVSIVLFSSEVDSVIEAQRGEQARERLDRLEPIEAVGGAALYDGLSQGAALLRRSIQPDTINQLILVADGPATKGPREREDFVRLAETLARERISISAVGLGEECEEDVLAAMVRPGGGQFLFAAEPSHLADTLEREIAPARAVVGTDAVLSIAYRPNCSKIAVHGARSATVAKNTVTCTFPRLMVGQDLSVLTSGILSPFGASGIQRDLVRIQLSWTDPRTGERREATEDLTIRFSTDSRDVADLFNLRVYRAAAAAVITEGMQDSIDQVDRGDFRRALRELRKARDQVRDINFTARDAEITAMVGRLDAYIAEVQARGMNLLDRKVLRSGLGDQFEMPVPEAEEAKRP